MYHKLLNISLGRSRFPEQNVLAITKFYLRTDLYEYLVNLHRVEYHFPSGNIYNIKAIVLVISFWNNGSQTLHKVQGFHTETACQDQARETWSRLLSAALCYYNEALRYFIS